MSVQDWFGLTLTALSILALVVGGIKFRVKHYLSELRPNSGSSLKDQVNRLEERVNQIYDHLLSK